jgi:hypothetical protein
LKGNKLKTKIAIFLLSFVAMVASFMLPDPRFMTDAYGQSIIDPDIPNPIIFAAQVPLAGGDFVNRMSTFGNEASSDHDTAGNGGAPRGGDLMIRYPDGTLRNLTQEAGYGIAGGTGSSNNQDNAGAIVVRDPAVHWDGNKALFSMIVSSVTANGYGGNVRINDRWQMYEVTGLRKGQKAIITKVPNQPTGYNNINAIYGTDDRIIFATDLPRGGDSAHLYPNKDEYEGKAVTSGLWSLKPSMAYNITSTNANLLNPRILDHSPSGNYQPFVDSFGRLIFMRWDHMIRDQQADLPDRFLRCDSNTIWAGGYFLPVTFDNETSGASRREVTRYDNHEIWPSRRSILNPKNDPSISLTGPCYTGNYSSNLWTYDGVNYSSQPSALPNLTPTLGAGFDTNAVESGPYGRVRLWNKNEFTLWQIWQDGTEGETLNHSGPHEFTAFLSQSFLDDTSLNEAAKPGLRDNKVFAGGSAGYFAPKEGAATPGVYYAVQSLEFANRTTGPVIRINAAPSLNPRSMKFTMVTTPPDGAGSISGGRFRTPLPLKNGKILASHTPTEAGNAAAAMTVFKIKKLISGSNGYMAASATNVTGVAAPAALTKVITEWDRSIPGGNTNALISRTVTMWELEPAEVVYRPRPATPTTFDKPVQQINTADAGAEAGNENIRATFTSNGVTMTEMRDWLIKYNLALMVTFDNTSRDAADRQQPINLRVASAGRTLADGVTPCTNPKQTLSDTYGPTNTGANASSPTGFGDTTRPIYILDYLQIIQANSIRGEAGGNGVAAYNGRRVIGQPVGMMTEPAGSPGAIFASVNRPVSLIGATDIECDGSSAVFVPTRRALAWQSTDDATGRGAPPAVPKLLEGSKTGQQDGTIANKNNGSSVYPASNDHFPLIRERVWVTAQPGEIRSCPGCHGSNDTNQAGIFTPTNYQPLALKKLLDYWKTYSGPGGAFPK